MTADFTGSGWNFPLQFDATSSIALASHARDIEQAIELIIRTAPGERPMRPEFGCRIQDHLFAPTNDGTKAAIAHDARRAIEMWEPRVDVENVLVSIDPHARNTFYIDVWYRIRGHNDERNLVFPFYLIPEEPGAPPVLPLTEYVTSEV
jgi:phage baseplate assembly protein W